MIATSTAAGNIRKQNQGHSVVSRKGAQRLGELEAFASRLPLCTANSASRLAASPKPML